MWQQWQKLVKGKAKKKEWTKEELISFLDIEKIPQHVAIIMDGNGRWAQKRGLPRAFGHKAGVESIRKVVKIADEIGVKNLTLYAFSTENWKRSSEEVNGLMQMLKEILWKEALKLHEKNIRITTIGHIEKLPDFAYQELQKSMELTKNNSGLTFNLALNYGGRSEIVSAAQRIAKDIKNGKISPDDIDESMISKNLFTFQLPDPELLIRTSGELRLSNFLLWQVAYTEFWITPTLWPDFQQTDFLKAILAYQKRDRRFGGVNL